MSAPHPPIRPPYVFVSYASHDRELVLAIVTWLESAGVHAWIDRMEAIGTRLWNPPRVLRHALIFFRDFQQRDAALLVVQVCSNGTQCFGAFAITRCGLRLGTTLGHFATLAVRRDFITELCSFFARRAFWHVPAQMRRISAVRN